MNKKLIVIFALLAVAMALADVPAPTTASCTTGYYWSNDSCIVCAANCASCTAPWGCSTCTYTYFRVSTTDESQGCYKPQSKQPDGTTTNSIAPALGTSCNLDCADLSGKTIGCVQCASGFGVQANACAACPANCATCTFAAATGAGTCTKCSLGFYPNASSVCTACPATLTNCLQCDATGATCAVCNVGFYNSGANGTCVACTGNAATCDASGKILTCQGGYFLDVSTPATPKCTACGTGCLVCSSATVCTTCTTWAGFYLASGVCTACPQTNAMFCTATSVIQCNTGFAIPSGTPNTCVAQLANCIKHTSATICTTCRTGYVFSAGACVKLGGSDTQVQFCSAATSATDATAKAVCTTCIANPTTGATKAYVIDSTTKACVACPDYATTCTVANAAPTVTACASGYTKATGSPALTCVSCAGIKDAYCVGASTSAAKCQTKNDGTGADCDGTNVAATAACNDGYVNLAASPTLCTACSANTKTCTAATTSTVCYDGYILASTACAAKCAASGDSNCAGAKCSSPKRYLTATTTEWVATVGTTCQIISDALSTANGVQDATTGKVTLCNNGYQFLSTGNTNAGSCILCSAASTGATDCNTCTGTATNTAYVCTSCATATNTLQGTSTVTGCAADANCAQIVSYKCVVCKVGYNLGTDGKCAACTGACTFSCPLPTTAGAGGAGSTTTTTKANSGSFLTFAFSAIVLILAALF